MYARAGYITNLSDLTLNLSASDINIGAVAIADSDNHLLRAQVNSDPVHGNSLQVQTQDLESTIDDVTIGDKSGNYASVVRATSSLNVNVTNKVQISSVNISDANWLFQVGRGTVVGASLKSFTGFTSAVGATFQPMWEDGTYTFPTSAERLTLRSTSNSDTNVSVFIDGLDADYNPLTETIVLSSGTAGVTTVNSYYRVNGISLTRTPMAVGRITIGNASPLAFIEAGTDRSAMTVFSVPNGYTFFLERVNAYCTYVVNTAGNNNVPINVFYRSNTVNNGLRNVILVSPFYSNYTSLRVSPRGYPQKTDCLWECRSESDTYKPSVGLQVEGVLISNAAL